MYKAADLNNSENCIVFVVIGASGDLSKKKIYPTLWSIYKQRLIAGNCKFIGYARSKLTMANLRKSFEQYMDVKSEDKSMAELFFSNNEYVAGSYDKPQDFKVLNERINGMCGVKNASRIFYLALPPSVFGSVTEMVRGNCWIESEVSGSPGSPGSPGSSPFARIIIEKPFGHDLASSNALSQHLSRLYNECEIYRIDHYLGKEMVKNLLVLRFGNIIFRSVWSRDCISSIQIVFKEPFGVEGRGGYFDDAGIIRDVIQNHLLQILSLIAMEKPLSITADSIRGEKLKALKAIKPMALDNLVIGQYVGDPNASDGKASRSYTDVEGVPKDSITPTYACAVLYVNNERWEGVPFILRCGKALNERKAEIRIQFKDVPGDIFASGQLKRNELVIRVQPGEAVYIKMMNKKPGGPNENEMKSISDIGDKSSEAVLLNVVETELELTYDERYKNIRVPDAYENLILDVFNGLQMDFVHMDELHEAWRIVDNALAELEKKKVKPYPYVYGSRNGPIEADHLIQSKGFVYSGTYVYNKPVNKL